MILSTTATALAKASNLSTPWTRRVWRDPFSYLVVLTALHRLPSDGLPVSFRGPTGVGLSFGGGPPSGVRGAIRRRFTGVCGRKALVRILSIYSILVVLGWRPSAGLCITACVSTMSAVRSVR